jgi:amino acid adenylation domain-containing protein
MGGKMTALLHELFEEQVRRAPDAVATRFRDRTMTYAALNARSNRLARRLRSAGLAPATVTAIAIPRSDLLVVAVMAILKAGGTYVYLESSDPPDRRRAVVLAAEASICISTGSAEAGPTSAVTIDVGDEYREYDDTDLRTAIPADQAAYVLFTSGSTGEPKGVLVSHRAVTSYLGWAVEEYGIANGTGAPVHTSLGFDLTVTSLFGPLMCARTVVLLPEANVMAELANELEADHDFSILKLTPSHLLLLNEYLDPAGLAGSVRTLVVGGEALRGEALETWRVHAPGTRVVNEYGPTEATVGCCRYWAATADRSGPVPIGTAAPTSQLYVLDDEMEPVPEGEVGELYLVGSQLAIGYLNNDELTRQHFIDLAVSPGERQRAYRTGDLVRRDERGCLVYVGRNDRQVKVRGYRVELGEIETVLLGQSGITAAHVTFSDGIISAYLQRRSESDRIDTPRLADRLRQALPAYMVPSRMLEIDEVPLTSNGKVDYQRLIELDDVLTRQALTREEMHEVMLEIWSAVLEVKIGHIDLNFFSLDGDSILAVQMVARARERGVPISLQEVFAQPTIRRLVDSVAGASDAMNADVELPEIICSVTQEGGLSR